MDKLAADWYITGKMYLIKDTGCLVGDSNGPLVPMVRLVPMDKLGSRLVHH